MFGLQLLLQTITSVFRILNTFVKPTFVLYLLQIFRILNTFVEPTFVLYLLMN